LINYAKHEKFFDMHRLNLDQLGTFLAVMERGSFSAAAEQLRLTQPAVSLQIRQLEKRFGTPLIERVGRTARPTAAGTELLAHAERIDAAVAGALEAVGRHASGTMGRVRLGTGATACIFLLPPLLGALRRKHPGLAITVTTGNTADIVRGIEDNLIDVGLVTLPASGRMLEITAVLDDAFVAISPRDMALPDRLAPQAFADLPVLLFEPGGNTRRLVDSWFGRAGVRLDPVMALGSVEAIKEMVAAGLGCAVLPGMAIPQQQGAAFRTHALSPPLRRQLAVVVRRDKRLHRGLKAVIDALHTLKEQRPLGNEA
jgi:DNA-binding transcriptional LysR family regulator